LIGGEPFQLDLRNKSLSADESVHSLVVQRALYVASDGAAAEHIAIVPVRTIADCSGPTLHRAIGRCSQDTAERLKSRSRYAVVLCVADSARANLARTRALATELHQPRTAAASCVLTMFLPCAIHRCQNVEDDLQAMTHVIDPMFCMCNIWSTADACQRLYCALREIVDETFVIKRWENPSRKSLLAEHCACHAEFRDLCLRVSEEDKPGHLAALECLHAEPTRPHGTEGSGFDALIMQHVSLCNGDVTQADSIEHVTHGSLVDTAEVAHAMCNNLMALMLRAHPMTRLAANKWQSRSRVQRHILYWTACHRLLPRVWNRAFQKQAEEIAASKRPEPTHEQSEGAQAGVDSVTYWRMQREQRVLKVTRWLNSSAGLRDMFVTFIALRPMDDLVRFLMAKRPTTAGIAQHFLMGHEQLPPKLDAMMQLYTALFHPDHHMWRHVSQHVGPLASWAPQAMQLTLRAAAGAWQRLVLFYKGTPHVKAYPFELLRMSDRCNTDPSAANEVVMVSSGVRLAVWTMHSVEHCKRTGSSAVWRTVAPARQTCKTCQMQTLAAWHHSCGTRLTSAAS